MITIKLEDIKAFSKKYNSNLDNKKTEKNITKNGLIETCIQKEIIAENPPIFNLELSETKRYDQKDSLRCWIFSGFNMIKRHMAEKLNMDVLKFELSDNYIAFFHRLEKANTTYENIIDSKIKNINDIVNKKILRNPVEETGNWATFINIVNKYGMVPLQVMPNVIESKRCIYVESLYAETVKKNALQLLQLKKEKKDLKEIRNIKKEMLAENYEFLAKVYGEPKEKFSYSYTDKEGNKIRLKDMTPIQFKQQFLTLDIQNFVFISNVPKYGVKYGQKLKNNSSINIREKKYVEFLHLTSQEQKELAIKQLKDNIPVMIGITIKKFENKKYGILDTRLYDYEKLVNYKRLTKEEGITIKDISLHHWMTITGVYLENNKPKRWKVEDSYGKKEKAEGYYIMNDNYFSDYVFTVIIHKKYLSKKQLELYNQKAIIDK